MILPDYEFKSAVLDFDVHTDILKIRSQVDYAAYLSHRGMPEEMSPLPYATADFFWTYFNTYYPKEWEEAAKINHAKFERTKRLRGKMHYLITHYDCSFLTLTFNDKCLESTSASSRRQYVSRFLNSLDCPYIANIDFGKENGREHYHAVVACIPSEDEMSRYTSGFFYVLLIRDTDNDITRIAKYVSKLTNHAIKETTNRSVLLYSRKYKIPQEDVHLT